MNKILIYKGTNTLDNYLDKNKYQITENKSKAECLLIGGKKVVLSEFPNLKGIFKTGVGTDNLPFQDAEKKGIKICLPSEKTNEFIYEETASYTCHLIFKSCYKNIGDWEMWYKKPREALSNKLALVIGKGRIGTKVFEKLKLFMKVDSYDILYDKPNTLKKKINQSDIISLHLPLNSDTNGFFNKEKLGWMKNNSLLVNTARAQIIDELDLFNELNKKRIRCALDVFWEEPYEGIINKIDNQNLLKSPHIASTCEQFLISAEEDFDFFLKHL